ncbi:MAG: hypothetical protein V5A55_11570 [Halovenus sp.]
MAVSRNPGNRSSVTNWLRLFSQLSWYDILLAIIPFTLTLPVVASVLFAVPLHVAVGFAGVVGMLLVLDALFIHPPVGASDR